MVEQGTHNELMQSNGIYAHMYKLQESWYANPSKMVESSTVIT